MVAYISDLNLVRGNLVVNESLIKWRFNIQCYFWFTSIYNSGASLIVVEGFVVDFLMLSRCLKKSCHFSFIVCFTCVISCRVENYLSLYYSLQNMYVASIWAYHLFEYEDTFFLCLLLEYMCTLWSYMGT